jgi:hypothetical protein
VRGVRKAGNRDGKLLRVIGNNQLTKHSLQRNPILKKKPNGTKTTYMKGSKPQ